MVTCRSFERTTPIWFDKVINMESHDLWGFMDARREMFSIASTNCLPHVIRLSEPLNEENISSNIAYFTEHLTQLPSRLSEIYSVYRLLANEVSKDTNVINYGLLTSLKVLLAIISLLALILINSLIDCQTGK